MKNISIIAPILWALVVPAHGGEGTDNGHSIIYQEVIKLDGED